VNAGQLAPAGAATVDGVARAAEVLVGAGAVERGEVTGGPASVARAHPAAARVSTSGPVGASSLVWRPP
jgi:hypothetical protein